MLRLAAYDPAIRGDVVYPPAFDGLVLTPRSAGVPGSTRPDS